VVVRTTRILCVNTSENRLFRLFLGAKRRKVPNSTLIHSRLRSSPSADFYCISNLFIYKTPEILGFPVSLRIYRSDVLWPNLTGFDLFWTGIFVLISGQVAFLRPICEKIGKILPSPKPFFAPRPVVFHPQNSLKTVATLLNKFDQLWYFPLKFILCTVARILHAPFLFCRKRSVIWGCFRAVYLHIDFFVYLFFQTGPFPVGKSPPVCFN